VNEEDHKMIGSFDLLPQDFPKLGIIDNRPSQKIPVKYLMEGEINLKNVKEFLRKWFNNELQPYILSEPIPAEQPKNTKIVVMKNYNDIVLNNFNDIVLLIYKEETKDDDEKKTKDTLFASLNELGKRLKSKDYINQHLTIGKINVQRNEVEHLTTKRITRFPTILLFPGNNKEKYYEYTGRFNKDSIEDMCDFISKHSANQLERDDL